MHKSVIGLIGIGVVIILMGVIMGALKSSATNSRVDSFSVTTHGRAGDRHCGNAGIAVEGADFIRAVNHLQLCVRLPVMRAGFRK